MKQPLEPTLSAHLLKEAMKFFLYPHSRRPSRGHSSAVRTLDEIGNRPVEWRKTFAARKPNSSSPELDNPVFIDEIYCRELLRQMPGIVERTMSLANLTLSGIAGESFVYLREAANCYIMNLPQAAVALARAAVEIPLRRATSKRFGAPAVKDKGLSYLLDLADRGRLLTPKARELADKIRRAGNKALHEEPTSSAEALELVEAARFIVRELSACVQPTRTIPLE